jgi:hypothetical protein
MRFIRFAVANKLPFTVLVAIPVIVLIILWGQKDF